MMRHQGIPVSVENLCGIFNREEEHILSAIKNLIEQGFSFSSDGNNSLILENTPDILSESNILSRLPDNNFYSSLYHHTLTDSTNIQAMVLAQNGEPSGTLVTAEEQSRGKGQHGKKWECPRYGGILVSVILKPKITEKDSHLITITGAVACCLAIKEITNIDTNLIWPNDIVYNNKKLGGLLTETAIASKSNFIRYAVLGIGINVNFLTQDLSTPFRDKAITIYEITGKIINRAALLSYILRYIHELYPFSNPKKFSNLEKEWSRLNISSNNEPKYVSQPA